MTHQDLPERWKNIIKEYMASHNEPYNQLGASNFETDKITKLYFEDESYAEFHFAVVIRSEEFEEVGVFTEHCGYHIFNQNAVKIEFESQ